MTRRQRTPYVLLMSGGGAQLILSARDPYDDGNWLQFVVSALFGTALLAFAAVLALRRRAGWVPEWAHRFELVAVKGSDGRAGRTVGAVLRCNRCDSAIIPAAPRFTLPRLLSYAFTHTTLACEPRRETDPEDTRRLQDDKRRRAVHRKGGQP